MDGRVNTPIPILLQNGFGRPEWRTDLRPTFCLAKAGGAPIPPAVGINRLSSVLSLYPNSEATRQWESVPHFHWEVVIGTRSKLNLYLIHSQGSVIQSTFAKVVVAETRENLNIHTQQLMC